MQIKNKTIERDGSGNVKLVLEEADDLWSLYNIIDTGDVLNGVIERKIVTTRDMSTQTVRSTGLAAVEVEKLDYQAEPPSLRASGKIVASEVLRNCLGRYHTVDLTLNSTVTISKDLWDAVHWRMLKDACDIKSQAEVAAVLLDSGKCNIFLITTAVVRNVSKLDVDIPKRQRQSHFNTGICIFFEMVASAIRQHIDLKTVQVVVLAGPGFVKNDFWTWLQQNYERLRVELKGRQNKFLIVNASSSYRHALNELLLNKQVAGQIATTRSAAHTQAVEQLYRTLATNPARAAYGERHVLQAVEQGAVETLLVTQGLFKNPVEGKRRQMVKICDEVERSGGNILVFSDLHTSGEQLSRLTGLAALLRFDVVDPDDL